MQTIVKDILDFKPLRSTDMAELTPLLHRSGSRSCDFTAGGIFMWVDYFGYEGAVYGNTLFISGLSEDSSRRLSFSLPVGEMPLVQSIDVLRNYCSQSGRPLLLSAVPEDRLADLLCCGPAKVEELPNWADYIYSIENLANLPGKAYNKKRNHVHRFMADNPGYRFEELNSDNIGKVIDFYRSMELDGSKADPVMAEYEREQCLDVLSHFSTYPFEGAYLTDGNDNMAAFTAAEIVGDTLVIHIEKMNHEISGAGETINQLFAAHMAQKFPELKFINREDDSGEPGLRHAKESYHPTARLRKFNVELDCR